MKFPGWLTPWRKQTDLNTVTPVRAPFSLTSRFGTVIEAFGGAWQSGLVIDDHDNLLKFSAVYSCVSLIAGDIAKLRLCLLRWDDRARIWSDEPGASPFQKVLRRPNRYQVRLQFIQQWMISKLLWGNTYVLIERDNRGVVAALYVLDPARVTPLVAGDGEIYYQLSTNRLAGVRESSITVPASEIIHDRGECPWHPLIGISPLYAAGISATQGRRIQSNSQRFFENMSRPSGQLTAPGTISDDTAARLKKEFEDRFSGANLGRIFVGGDGLKFEAMTMPAEQAQLIEQLKWTGEDVARAFLVPAYKIGLGAAPSLGHVAALNQEYYQQVLQKNIEAIEDLLDAGLALPADLSAEFDLDQLVRMDGKTRAETTEIKVRSGTLSPNEARRGDNLPPVVGGESPYLQQQNFSLAALARRDAREDPFSPAAATPPATPPAPTAPAANDDIEDPEEARAAFLGALK